MITGTALEKIVQDENIRLFKSEYGISLGPLTASHPFLTGLSTAPHKLPRGVFCGTTSNGSLPSHLGDLIKLNSPSHSGCVAVGHVLSNHTGPSSGACGVIIAIGINYTQDSKGFYLTKKVPLWDASGMLPQIATYLTRIACNPSLATNVPAFETPGSSGNFHLVISNIFPVLTKIMWNSQKINNLEELLLIHELGFASPIGHLVSLIQRLPEGVMVFFHGAGNAVPYFGKAIIDVLKTKAAVVPPTFFTDNLSVYPLTKPNLVKLV